MKDITFTPFAVMSLANEAKANRGTAIQKKLFSMFSEEERIGRIASFTHKYTVGRAGYSQKQFFAPFMLQFCDGERWLIYSTPSLRDRVKMDQWDAKNIKDIDCAVTKAYLVYPPNINAKARKAFESKNRKYVSHEEYSALDGLMDWHALLACLRQKSDEIYSSMYTSSAETTLQARSKGRHYDYVGRAFERDIADVLSNADFLSAINSGRQIADPRYTHFKMMMEVFDIKTSYVSEIKATANHRDIGELPSGGKPKTDVIMVAKMKDGSEILKTISCKRVTRDTVSAHQYKADEYAMVLNPNDEELRLHLNYFQMAGCFERMPEGAEEKLGQLLSPYAEKLCYWAVGGNGGSGKEHQIAKYIVTYRPKDNRFAVHTVDEYVRKLLARPSTKKGGTPFSLTYQGERGTNIQLKMPILF